jgi:putative ABC transport system permease protein
MFRTALRNVLAHKARLLMTALAVMLGVAFVSGTLVFTDTLGKAFSQQSAKSYDGVSVVAGRSSAFSSPDDPQIIPAGAVEKISRLDGVTAVTGRVSGFTAVGDKDGKLIGSGWSNKGTNFAPGKDGEDAAYDFVQGSGPAEAGQIALDRDTADKGGYKIGDTIRVATNGPVKEYTLQGVFTTEDGAVNAGGSLVLFTTDVAQKLFLKPGHFHEVSVSAAPGTEDEKLRAAVAPLLPKDIPAETADAIAEKEAKDIEQEMSAMNSMLLAFAAIALFVGVFLIANTFTMLVAQRTKELALLRAVGASRRQVKRSVILEAVVVGTFASVVGFFVGLLLATGMRPLIGSFGAKIPGGSLVVSGTAVFSAFAVGVLITVLAAWLPARRAAKIAPVAAMSSVHAAASTKSLVVRNTIGAIITSIGLVSIFAGAGKGGTDGRLIIGAGAFLTLVGVIVLIPLLSRPMIAGIRPLFSKVFGISGKLAGQNAVRNPRRTGATASALAIGLTLVTGLTVIGVTLGQAIDRMTTDNVRGDYLVSMANNGAMDSSALEALRKADGVTAISPIQNIPLEFKGEHRAAGAADPASVEKLFTVETVSGSMASLADGKVAIGEKTAKENNWKPGDSLAVKIGTGDKEASRNLTVGAVFKENDFLMPFMISDSLANQYTEKPEIGQIWLAMEGGQTSANEKSVRDALGNNPGMNIMDREGIRSMFGGMINTMLYIMYGLLGMALIIAVLGVVNTLAMSVFERQQEIGMLRAIGLEKGKVKRMIRLEAIVISLFGAVIGVVLGSFLAWAIGETFKNSIPNYELIIPFDRIALFLLLAGVVGMLAALWPARSAARLNMLAAIKAE